MKSPGNLYALAASSALLLSSSPSDAQSLVYSQDFDSDSTAEWTVNYGSGDNMVNFYFDYSLTGIPSAPHSTGGSTRGLTLQPNMNPTTQAGSVAGYGLSVCPTGFSITENFEMRFDMWLNYPKSLNGSTIIGGAGFGTDGTTVQLAGSVDSIFIGASTDGGSSADYRVYVPAGSSGLQDATGVYIAGGRNNTLTYYVTNFPSTTPPQAQTNLFPSQTGLASPAGTVPFKWCDVSLKKVANLISYSIDGVPIAVVDASTNGTLGGANILFNAFDINGNASTDPLSTNLLFVLIDNVRITNFPAVVSVTAVLPNASEAGPTAGMFTLSRNSSGAPLTVNYTVGGTATPGADYNALSGSVTFAATETSKDITITTVDDAIAEFTETVILSVADGPGYTAGGSATVYIADNDPVAVDISVVSDTVYERVTNDYARFKLTRRGDLNAASFTVNLTYSGNAVKGADYAPVDSVVMDSGVQSVTFDVHPIDNSVLNAARTITVAAAPGTGYSLGTNTPVSATIVDDETPVETVLWSDNLRTDSSANWNAFFGSVNVASGDYTITWAYDYSTVSLPAAPHSGTDTHGLLLTVNKIDALTEAAGLNLYPKDKTFSGNFALRFDMYLVTGTTSATEYGLFGINHSGTRTNWFRSGGVPVGWEFDGLFYYVESDAAAQFINDYVLNSSPNSGNNPTTLASRDAASLTNVFKSPPWVAGLAGGGSPAVQTGSETPTWSDVEVSQIGNVVTLTINRTPIFSYTNTTSYTSGNIMLGYDDAFDSIGSPEACVIYANARVISLAAPSSVAIQVAGGNALIDFTCNSADVPSQFKLQYATSASGPFADVDSTITSVSAGHLRATKALAGNTGFYRIRRVY